MSHKKSNTVCSLSVEARTRAPHCGWYPAPATAADLQHLLVVHGALVELELDARHLPLPGHVEHRAEPVRGGIYVVIGVGDSVRRPTIGIVLRYLLPNLPILHKTCDLHWRASKGNASPSEVVVNFFVQKCLTVISLH